MQDGKLVLLAAKIVDDNLVTGTNIMVDTFILGFDEKFNFVTIVHGPGNLLFYGLNIVQNEDFT